MSMSRNGSKKNLKKIAPTTTAPSWVDMPILKQWSAFRSLVLLSVVTLLCLLPFSDKAFHIDDPLFMWMAQQITKHPLDPYGFQLVWYTAEMPMSEVMKNPPLASYYAAAVGAFAGWSERALHLGFLLSALTLVLGAYYLARRFTRFPLVAAAAALLTPAFLVSASSVMCDTMMLALWVWAAILWIEGLDPIKPVYLITSGLLMSACALTKYFGVCLMPLLLAYSIARQRRLGTGVFYLMIPLIVLGGYQFWTNAIYGRGLLSDAAEYAGIHNRSGQTSVFAQGLVGLAFTGGCMLPALTVIPLLWSRKHILAGIILGGLAWLGIGMGWVNLPAATAAQAHWTFVSGELALCITGGISILALSVLDFWERKTADSLFLILWVFGTFFFAVFLNWTINARSLLPLIPAAAILLARRIEVAHAASGRWFPVQLLIALVVSGVISLWVTWGDTDLANSAKNAAVIIHEKTQQEPGNVFFEGHWGFQYYMQSFGHRPVDVVNGTYHRGDIFVIPQMNTNVVGLPPGVVTSGAVIQLELTRRVTTMSPELGAGFYSSLWGPLPFAFGPAPPERYTLVRLAQ